MQYTYTPKGVCSQKMIIEVENDIIKSVKIIGGCAGNTVGVSRLIEGMNIDEAIKRLNSFKNVLTSIDSNVRKEAIKTLNFQAIALCLFDKMFFEGKSDGMVYTSSQRKVEDVLDIKSYSIKSHHDVNSNIRAFNEVLGIVDDTIDEFDDKNKILIKWGSKIFIF